MANGPSPAGSVASRVLVFFAASLPLTLSTSPPRAVLPNLGEDPMVPAAFPRSGQTARGQDLRTSVIAHVSAFGGLWALDTVVIAAMIMRPFAGGFEKRQQRLSSEISQLAVPHFDVCMQATRRPPS